MERIPTRIGPFNVGVPWMANYNGSLSPNSRLPAALASVKYLRTAFPAPGLGVLHQLPSFDEFASRNFHGVASRVWPCACLISIMTMEEKEWRQLCAMVAKESDPQRLSELVDQIIVALDAQDSRNRKDEARLNPPADTQGSP